LLSKGTKNNNFTFFYKKISKNSKKRLINCLTKKGLTQEEVAKKMQTSKSNISRLESLSNKYVPNLMILIKYANALGCKIDLMVL